MLNIQGNCHMIENDWLNLCHMICWPRPYYQS